MVTATTRRTKRGASPPHHVGVGLARHLFAGVEVKELVHLGSGQPVADLQVLDGEDLAGRGQVRRGGAGVRRDVGVHLVLELHLEEETILSSEELLLPEVQNAVIWAKRQFCQTFNVK